MTSSNLPILYSFRRCPYAMRARLAIAGSGIAVELREIVLRDKPAVMLDASRQFAEQNIDITKPFCILVENTESGVLLCSPVFAAVHRLQGRLLLHIINCHSHAGASQPIDCPLRLHYQESGPSAAGKPMRSVHGCIYSVSAC